MLPNKLAGYFPVAGASTIEQLRKGKFCFALAKIVLQSEDVDLSRTLEKSQRTAMQKSLVTAESRIPELDVLRGLAVSLVFGFHATGYAYGYLGHQPIPWNGMYRNLDVPPSFFFLLPFQLGSSGVAIFFAISGFCIHYFYKDLSSVRRFYTRRFARILPPYWFLLIIVTTIPFIQVELFNETLQVQFFSHLFLVHNFSKQTIYGIVPAWWTIAVEIQLYLLYPFVLWCINRRGITTALLVTGSLELLLRGYHSFLTINGYDGLPSWLTGSPFYFWFSWTLGACAAEWRNARPLLNNSPALHSGLALLLMACFLFRPIDNFLFPLISLWTSLILASNIRYPYKSALFLSLAKLGVVSYSFYLITDSILFNCRNLLSEIVGRGAIEFILLLAMFGPTYLLAKYLYAKVERPSQQLGKKLYKRQRRLQTQV